VPNLTDLWPLSLQTVAVAKAVPNLTETRRAVAAVAAFGGHLAEGVCCVLRLGRWPGRPS